MSIGNTPTLSMSQLNQTLGQVAVNLRNDMSRALEFFQGVNSLGVTGLEGLGFSNQDATDFYNACNYLQSVAQVYFGTATQAALFNFDLALAEARGTQ